MEECHKLLTDQVDDVIIKYNVSKPLPLSGQPGQVTIQVDFFFNKDLEYLRYGSKGGRPALSISKMKAACYPDVGLEQMVPDQMWIEEECKYDIAAMYDTMADVNVNAPAEQAPAIAPPTRTNDQILPRIRWVPHTNLFRAFTASSTILSIYIQQFWDTVRYVKNTRSYSCQLDEQWFDLTKDTLRDALQITLVDNNNPFSSPPTPDALINFVNELGYPKVIRTLSAVVTNDMFQAWRALTTIINLCLTGKTSAFERPRAPGKKKANPLMIPSVRFTKLIIHHLQSKHKFHPRPDSLLHLPYEEYVLGYLKFSTNVTKREVFGMPIPNDLITDDIRGEQYYAYLEKVAKHQRYLAGEEISDPDSPAPKPAKATKPEATKKSKPLAPKEAPITKPVATKASMSQQPKPAPAKPQEKKRKMVMETSEAPSLAKRSKAIKEPVYGDEEADTQREIEESLKEVHDAHRGPLPPVVIIEPDFGKFQLLPDVQGKGKEKVGDEQVALDLLTLQTPKKKSPAEQYIFQRRSSAPTEPSGHNESSSLYEELGLTDSETKSDEEVPGINAGDQDKGQARPNPGRQDEGQAGSNPGDAVVSQPQSSHDVHARPNREHMDFEVTDSSIQQNPEQMDEEFTTMAYPNVQENLKLPTEDQVRLEEPASFAGTLSSLQNFDKELSFADQFLVEKSQEDEPEKTNTESKVQSMVTVPIHQDTSSVPLMTTSVIDLIVSQPVSTMVQAPLPTSTANVTAIIKTTDRFKDLAEADMKEILHHRMWETNSYKAHEDHKKLKKKKRHDSPKTPPGSPPHQPPPPPPPEGPSGTSGASRTSRLSQLPHPPPPPSTNQSDQSKSIAAPSSSKTTTLAEYTAWTTTDTRLKLSVSSIPKDLHMDADSALDKQVHSFDDEDIGNDHIPKVNLKQDWWKPFLKEDRPATPEPA
ncbi:hypothetical protein Tco_0313545 [Tanacetum coccineum]